MDYATTLRKAILKLNQRGFSSFRASLPEYDPPTVLKSSKGEVVFSPDIEAEGMNGEKAYFEIAQKTGDESQLARKWELLHSLAQMKAGIFNVLVPQGHMRFTQDLARKYSMQLELAKL